jgi:hypothetical protein
MHSMVLKVTTTFYILYVPSLVANCLVCNSSGALLLVDSGFSGDFSVCGIVWSVNLVVNCLAHNYSSALFLVDSGFSGDFYVRGIQWSVILSLNSLHAQLLDFLGNLNTMDTMNNELHQDEEMVENKIEER